MADYSSENYSTEIPSGEFGHDGMNYTLIQDDIINLYAIQTFFYIIYGTIFVLGIFGNILVCYVVGRNRGMQTVTNFFITNLAMADILLCGLAVPFTPLYTFLQEWIFGDILCHLVAYAQGTSVYISTLTLTSIAIDRYFVIMYPFKPRMKVITCFLIISSIWIFALLATLPYGIFLQYKRMEGKYGKYACIEAWPSERTRQIFSAFTAIIQFVLPLCIISFCYVRISLKLSHRAMSKPGTKNSRKEAIDRDRKQRTNRMLIAMVTVFGISWLPLSLVNLLNDVYMYIDEWEYYNLCFFLAHAIAMSSTCYNPFLYAWLNENFRKEFKQVLPFLCRNSARAGSRSRSMRYVSEKTCNGNETVQEFDLPTTSQSMAAGTANSNFTSAKVPETIIESIEDHVSSSPSDGGDNDFEQEQIPMSKYCSSTDQLEIHLRPQVTEYAAEVNEIRS